MRPTARTSCWAAARATIAQFLRAGLIDEMHVAIVPIMLGDGERLFNNLAGRLDQYECVELVSPNAATHARITRSPDHPITRSPR